MDIQFFSNQFESTPILSSHCLSCINSYSTLIHSFFSYHFIPLLVISLYLSSITLPSLLVLISTSTSKQDEPKTPSNTGNLDAICNGNSLDVAPTTTYQRHHEAQPTCTCFSKGGPVGSRGKTTGLNPSPNPSNYNQG